MSRKADATAVILAAGKGTRMRSHLPKVLHAVCGKPMLHWAIEAAQQVCSQVVVVLGHEREKVLLTLPSGISHAVQDPPQGTGDAVRVASPLVQHHGVVLVLPGDAPLIKSSTLLALLEGHGDALCSVLTAHITPEEAPHSGYGRIVRDDNGKTLAIVETANASAQQKTLTEINTGIYAFNSAWLFDEVLPHLKAHPPKNEYYLTDAIEEAAKKGRLQAIEHHNLTEVTGVNDRIALAELQAQARRQINRDWMAKGVRFEDPSCTYVDSEVSLAQDVELGPGVVLRGNTSIGPGAKIGPYCVVEDSQIAANVVVASHSVLNGAVLEEKSSVGPFSRLREGTHLEAESKIGNFVEVKKSRIGAGAKASHLSYLGDADIGERANIGAGTITCNYDGFNKHQTSIGTDAFIGSNTALVAPVEVGDHAMVAAGSVVTETVPPDAIAVGRAQQKNLEDAAQRFREKRSKKEKSN